MNQLDKYEDSIGYSFRDRSLLIRALTHRSAGAPHNERLEFLGDAVLELVISGFLFDRFGNVDEGDLSRMRSTLVRETTLAEIAHSFSLGDYLNMGPGEQRSGGFRRDSILADAVEATIGAIYLDTGEQLETVRDLLGRWFSERLKTIRPGIGQKDPKTRLQEYLQAREFHVPVYSVVEVSGQQNSQLFKVSCSVEPLGQAVFGTGTSKRRAEQDAAEHVLEILRKSNGNRK